MLCLQGLLQQQYGDIQKQQQNVQGIVLAKGVEYTERMKHEAVNRTNPKHQVANTTDFMSKLFRYKFRKGLFRGKKEVIENNNCE
jgi:hypothetical protein